MRQNEQTIKLLLILILNIYTSKYIHIMRMVYSHESANFKLAPKTKENEFKKQAHKNHKIIGMKH